MGGVAVGIVIFFVFLSTRLNTTDMSLLYSELDSGDSSKIISKLETMGVPYKLQANGRQIMVPSDNALRLRMTMAEDGLPNGGSVGYEIFDRSASLGVTNFVQNINLLRALEGELARTIRSLNDVQEARVHLVLPKRELFSRQRQEPSASVVVKTRGRQKLNRSNVVSIQHLVAAAVPGLKLSRISIIDGRGRLLARAGAEGKDGAFIAGNNDEMQRAHEQRLIRVIERLLEQSVGVGKVRAQVTAEMDFDRITTQAESYDPDGQVVRSTQSVEESADSNDQSSKKSVSVGNDLPNNQNSQGGDASNSSRSTRTEETVNYEISKTIKSHVRETGSVRRLSIAVLVDGTYSSKQDGSQTYQPRSQAELDKLAKLVSSAVGLDAKRGDALEIINMRFVNGLDEDIGPAPPLFGLTKADYFRIAEIFVLAAVGILVILLVVRPLVSRTLEALPSALASAEQSLLAATSADAPALAGPRDTGISAFDRAEPIDDGIDVAQVEGQGRASSLKKIEEIVERHPEETVGIIRQWMNQEG
jgi:flagellar M-ring protein FliF